MSIIDTLAGKAQSTLNNMIGNNATQSIIGPADYLRNPASSSFPPLEHNDYLAYITCSELGINMTAQLPDTWQFDISSEYSAPYAEGLTEGIPSMLAPGLKAAGVSLTTQVLTAQLWKGSSEITFTLPLVFQAEYDSDREIMKPLLELMALTLPRDSQGGGGMLSAPGPHFDLVDTTANPDLNSGKAESKTTAGSLSIGQALSDAGNVFKTVGGAALDVGLAGGGAVVGALTVASNPDGLKSGVTNLYHTANKYISPLSNKLASMVKNRISLSIGNMLTFDSVVIINVQQNHKVQPTADISGQSTGLYQKCEITVTFKTFFTPTQRDLIKMFPNAPIATDNIRTKLLGGW